MSDDDKLVSRSLEGPETISPARLARFWGVNVQTVYRDLRKGALRGFRLPGGDIRIRVSDARRYGRPIE
jgi:predicted site-specific integrase-resolvase